jgi:predicted nicotinamide N-methyase
MSSRHSDPRSDVVAGRIVVRGGEIAFSHPRAGVDLLYEEVPEEEQSFPPYWAEPWSSGIELAYRVSTHALEGFRVLELGCGLGLPSVAAARAGARVLATDRSPDALGFTTTNACRNGVTVETAVCPWDEPGVALAGAPWRLVLASDVLYEQRNVGWLLALLPRLVDESGEVWIADPNRKRADEFLAETAVGWWTSTSATRIPEVSIHRLCRRPGQAPLSGRLVAR